MSASARGRVRPPPAEYPRSKSTAGGLGGTRPVRPKDQAARRRANMTVDIRDQLPSPTERQAIDKNTKVQREILEKLGGVHEALAAIARHLDRIAKALEKPGTGPD